MVNLKSQKELNGGDGYFYETDYRGYDPQLGRFKQYEPLADIYNGISPYQYAYNNPVSFNDPLGLMSEATNTRRMTTEADALMAADEKRRKQEEEGQEALNSIWDEIQEFLKKGKKKKKGNKKPDSRSPGDSGGDQADDDNKNIVYIRPVIRYDNKQPINNIHALGFTTYYNYAFVENEETGENGVIVYIIINMHEEFRAQAPLVSNVAIGEADPNAPLERENPGLHDEVLEHEKGHLSQYYAVANEEFEYNDEKATLGVLITNFERSDPTNYERRAFNVSIRMQFYRKIGIRYAHLSVIKGGEIVLPGAEVDAMQKGRESLRRQNKRPPASPYKRNGIPIPQN